MMNEWKINVNSVAVYFMYIYFEIVLEVLTEQGVCLKKLIKGVLPLHMLRLMGVSVPSLHIESMILY